MKLKNITIAKSKKWSSCNYSKDTGAGEAAQWYRE